MPRTTYDPSKPLPTAPLNERQSREEALEARAAQWAKEANPTKAEYRKEYQRREAGVVRNPECFDWYSRYYKVHDGKPKGKVEKGKTALHTAEAQQEESAMQSV